MVLGVVAVVLLVTWRPQPDAVKVVDITAFVRLVSDEASFTPRQISPALNEYRPTSVRWEPTPESEGQPVWFLGYVTPDGEYLQISQSTTDDERFLDEQTAGGVAEGALDIDGQEWERFSTEDRRSLVQRGGDHVTIVSGTQSWDGLATSAAILMPVD